MTFIIPLIVLLTGLIPGPASAAPRYAVATEATPVLSRPDFPAVFDGRNPATDKCGQNRAVETHVLDLLNL